MRRVERGGQNKENKKTVGPRMGGYLEMWPRVFEGGEGER